MPTITSTIKSTFMVLGAIVLIWGAANAYLGVPLPDASQPTQFDATAAPDTQIPDDVGASSDNTPTATPTTPTRQSEGELSRAKIESAIHELVNERRKAHGSRPLMYDDILQHIARKHSLDMANNSYVGHEDSEGRKHPERYDAGNYDCSGASGENVAQVWAFQNVEMPDGTTTYADTEREVAQMVVDLWMSSSGHRRNLLNDQFNREGIGVRLWQTDDGLQIYVTQNFC